LEKTFVKCCWCARLLRMDALPAHGYLPWLTGAHGNERNAGGLCIAAGSSGLARAQAMLTGEMYRTHALSGTTERRAWRDARCGLCARFVSKLRQEPKGVNHGPFDQRPEWPAGSRTVALRRQHTHCRRSRGTSLATVQERRQGVCGACCVCRPQRAGPEPRPDVHARCSSS
jgi:hypothetical protein